MRATIYIGRERPGLSLYWIDSSGSPVDFTVAGVWTYTVTIEQNNVTSVLAGATVTANASPTTDTGSSADVPTLSMSFAAGSLDNLTVGPAVLRVAALASGLDRLGIWHIEVAQ
jgi:hypothetical protein